MMVKIGSFFFKYRNFLFIFLYLILFVPSPKLFTEEYFGPNYWFWPIVLGLLITISGQIVRAATIGLAYIIRGGKDGKVHADQLVTQGIFNHCRNPLYVGNILMLLGVGVLADSLVYVAIVIPLFILIYQAIVLTEENYLRNKFGENYDSYCHRVNRWIPSLKNITSTFESMKFNKNRWILKEYNTLFVWLTGITLLLLFKYPQLTRFDHRHRNLLLAIILPILTMVYLFIRYLKKSKRLTE